MPDTEHTSVTRELVCTLNEAELLERGDQIADAELRTEQLKAERRRLNAQLREQSDRRAELATIIESKSEQREVPCAWRPDYKKKIFVLVRNDTKEEIDTRAMSETDLQLRLSSNDFDDDERDDNGHANGKKKRASRKRASKAK